MSTAQEQAIKKLQGEVIDLHEAQQAMGRNIAHMSEMMGAISKQIEALGDVRGALATYTGLVTKLQDQWTTHIADAWGPMSEQLEHLTAKVEGRNRSAAVKRNMTDADALRVLTGDLKEHNHKEAAEMAGLTYAQVYSCRGGFTFKHVIHELEKGGWKNTWEKPKKQNR